MRAKSSWSTRARGAGQGCRKEVSGEEAGHRCWHSAGPGPAAGEAGGSKDGDWSEFPNGDAPQIPQGHPHRDGSSSHKALTQRSPTSLPTSAATVPGLCCPPQGCTCSCRANLALAATPVSIPSPAEAGTPSLWFALQHEQHFSPDTASFLPLKSNLSHSHDYFPNSAAVVTPLAFLCRDSSGETGYGHPFPPGNSTGLRGDRELQHPVKWLQEGPAAAAGPCTGKGGGCPGLKSRAGWGRTRHPVFPARPLSLPWSC